MPDDDPVTSATGASVIASHSAADGHTAVDRDGLAGDPRRVLGQQERRELRSVLRHTEALQRVVRGDLVLTTFVQRAGELRLHYRRSDAVDPDSGTELDGELAGQVDDRGLARVVGADRRTRTQTAHRRDVDDGATVVAVPRLPRLLRP